MKAIIFDYGAGNLHSLTKALTSAGVSVQLETDPARSTDCDLLVLPGVGAFGPAAKRLQPGLAAIRAALHGGLPCLGICLGMQLLFESSEEGEGNGLGIFRGSVTRLKSARVPQIGWNSIDSPTDALFESAGLATAYFANGFVCRPDNTDVVSAWSEHDGDIFPASVRSRNILGVQFHPEKSSAAGLRFIAAYIQECGA